MLNEELLIKLENERLIDGLLPVYCDVFDNHQNHLNSHIELMHSELEDDIIERIHNHVQEHIDMLHQVCPE